MGKNLRIRTGRGDWFQGSDAEFRQWIERLREAKARERTKDARRALDDTEGDVAIDETSDDPDAAEGTTGDTHTHGPHSRYFLEVQ